MSISLLLLINWIFQGSSLDNEHFTVGIRGCTAWTDGTLSDSLEMKLSTTEGVSKYFVVNPYNMLPINGENNTYEISVDNLLNPVSEDFNLLTANLVLYADNYCINSLIFNFKVQNSATIKTYDLTANFGTGVVLSQDCEYAYKYIDDNTPLLPCFDVLELSTYKTRRVHKAEISTCVIPGSGMDLKYMKNNIYMTLTGTLNGSDALITTDIIDIDHYIPGTVNFDTIGTLVRDALTVYPSGDARTRKWYPEYTNDVVMAILLVAADEQTKNHNELSTYNVEIYTEALNIKWQKPYDNGKYKLIRLAKPQLIDTGFYFIIELSDNAVGYPAFVNVKFLFWSEQFSKNYGLPFIMSNKNNTVNWIEASQNCLTEYGTELTSIHSEEENDLLGIYIANSDSAWIGYNNRKYGLSSGDQKNIYIWSDNSATDYINWAPNQPDNHNDAENCVEYRASSGEWNDVPCTNGHNAYRWWVCASPDWSISTTRIFEINIKEELDNITLISVGNKGDDAICIDYVEIDGVSSKYISTNWIGTDVGFGIYYDNELENSGVYYNVNSNSTFDYNETDPSNIWSFNSQNINTKLTKIIDPSPQLFAVFEWPVCAIQVIDIRPKMETKTSHHRDTTIVAGDCKNFNAFTETSCDVSQTISTTVSTSFEVSKESSTTQGYSTSRETTFSFGVEASASLSLKASAGFFGTGVETTVAFGISVNVENSWSSSQSWSTDISKSNSKSYATTNDAINKISCSASTPVPPSTSVHYSFKIVQANTTISTLTDLELILCSSYFSDDDSDNSIYIYNIPGTFGISASSKCSVIFEEGSPLHSTYKCNELQKLAISTQVEYVPICNKDDTDHYEPCQCRNSGSIGFCYCVNEISGTQIGGTSTRIDNDQTMDAVCKQLNCDSSTTSPTVPTRTDESQLIDDTDNIFQLMLSSKDWKPFIIAVWVLVCLCFIGTIIFGYTSIFCIKKNKIQNRTA
eukprot:162294_1